MKQIASRRWPVHPRGRGEHVRAGSSANALCRFIPAGAGNTALRNWIRTCRAVHPRGRGEHTMRLPFGFEFAGSSPRARGTHALTRQRLDDVRFIPAGAGNTHHGLFEAGLAPVHPRGRGEHLLDDILGTFDSGSSPRARGTRPDRHHRTRHLRFIPAGAGNTWYSLLQNRIVLVHPRGRGEHRRRQ